MHVECHQVIWQGSSLMDRRLRCGRLKETLRRTVERKLNALSFLIQPIFS
uniref:Uncharacterized protein n=1 Tax=Arion vulgaris TaxID=1028688 RepID=A0A0B6Z3S5_9EUPU